MRSFIQVSNVIAATTFSGRAAWVTSDLEASQASLTEPLIDSGFDSRKCRKDKKAHRIMGLDVVTGGPEGMPTQTVYAVTY